jgi:hypothetical protein
VGMAVLVRDACEERDGGGVNRVLLLLLVRRRDRLLRSRRERSTVLGGLMMRDLVRSSIFLFLRSSESSERLRGRTVDGRCSA